MMLPKKSAGVAACSNGGDVGANRRRGWISGAFKGPVYSLPGVFEEKHAAIAESVGAR